MQSTYTSEFSLSSLDAGQRLLLSKAATLTEMLESANLETIRLRILVQRVQPAERRFDLMFFSPGEPVLRRKFLLHGEQSGKIYIHGELSAALDRLSDPVRRDLLATDIPLEKLWKRHGIEGVSEVLHSATEPARELAFYFGLEVDDPLIVRTCRLSSDGRPVMLITEHLEVPK